MIHMEGTRHEKILLVVVAYIIGFITAYIAFTVDRTDGAVEVPVAPAKAENTTPPARTPAAPEAVYQTSAVQENGAFYVVVDGERRRLSVNLAGNSQASSVIDSGIGGYYEPIINAVSSDGRHVFYCERNTPDTDLCTAFVYSVEDELTYMLASQNEKELQLAIAQEDVRWQPNNLLIVGEYASVNADRPWKVTAR